MAKNQWFFATLAVICVGLLALCVVNRWNKTAWLIVFPLAMWFRFLARKKVN